MDRTERFFKIKDLLRQRCVVSFAALQAGLEVSRSTLKRDMAYLSTRLNNWPKVTANKRSARCHRCGWCTTEKTGTWTHGAICATACATLRWIQFRRRTCWTRQAPRDLRHSLHQHH